MEINLNPGKYVLAVSGGVDSMVLLDLLKSHLPNFKSQIVVAHFDHGIHPLSSEQSDFVKTKAKQWGLGFALGKGDLGPAASEEKARNARYAFLRKVKKEINADAILTAHHEDDLIETVLINFIRGTGRKGLASLSSTDEIIRPLLGYSQKMILDYAKDHGVEWVEDPTNKDTKYLRNYLRIQILPKMDAQSKKKLLNLAEKTKVNDKQIENIIREIIPAGNNMDRRLFAKLDHKTSKEVLADFLRNNKIPFDAKLLEKGVNFIKTAKRGKKFVTSKHSYLEVRGDKVELNLL